MVGASGKADMESQRTAEKGIDQQGGSRRDFEGGSDTRVVRLGLGCPDLPA